jgi:hypothetical protein
MQSLADTSFAAAAFMATMSNAGTFGLRAPLLCSPLSAITKYHLKPEKSLKTTHKLGQIYFFKITGGLKGTSKKNKLKIYY